MTLNFKTLAIAATFAALCGANASAAQDAAAAPAPPPSSAGCADDIRHNATREQIAFESRGNSIPGLIYKPQVSNGAGVVLLHGFLGLQGHAPLYDPHAIQLASRGYTVLVPSYFDARPWRQRFNGSDIGRWSETGVEAVRFLATQPGIDPKRVGLWGYSLGGYLATDGAMGNDAAALAVGVSAGTDIYSETRRGSRQIPILMVHGSNDPSVSLRSMRGLASNLSVRGAKVDIEIVNANEHAMDAPTWCRVFQLTRAFLDTHIVPASGAAAPAS